MKLAMTYGDGRVFTLVLGAALCLAVIGCGPRVGAGAGPETAPVDPADSAREVSNGQTSDDELSDDALSDENRRDVDASDGQAVANRAAVSSEDSSGTATDRDKDDVEPFARKNAGARGAAEPERDAKGRKKLEAPEKTRSPSLNKPPAKATS